MLLKANHADELADSSTAKEAEKEELDIATRLAGDGLHLRGEERPIMKEKESTLVGIRRTKNK